MGFHDIGRLNQALLGKQASHIWSQPDSLVARVLEGKYFNKCGFLECGRYSTKSGLKKMVGTQRRVVIDYWNLSSILNSLNM